MPTPIEVFFEPVSMVFIGIFSVAIFLEYIAPGRKQTKPMGWVIRTLITFISYFYLSAYLPLYWDQHLVQYQIFNLEDLGIYSSTLVAVLVFELMIYIWHRTMHSSKWLWLIFHQLHHSAERVDALGAFYFSPLDMIGFTFIGSLTLTVMVGLDPQAVTYFLYITTFLAIFQHTNIKTPRWLGYLIQRPESHSIHHQKGVHAYNYSDLPIFDIIFGTFKNPDSFEDKVGFYSGASAKVGKMLIFRDISKKDQ